MGFLWLVNERVVGAVQATDDDSEATDGTAVAANSIVVEKMATAAAAA